MRIPLPSRWRDSIAGDLEEDRLERLGQGRRAGVFWYSCQALRLAARLWLEELSIARVTRPRSISASAFAGQLRQSARVLLRRPGYSLAVIATLAIGIGATNAVFSLANWLLFRPVPSVHEPDRLVSIRLVHPAGGVFTIAHPEIDAIRTRVPGLVSAAGSIEASFHVVAGEGTPERVPGEIVSANYFDVLGVRPAMGRAFSATDRGVVVSHAFWQTRLGGSPGVIGMTLLINGKPQPLLAVAPRGFSGASRSRTADVWAPSTLRETVLTRYRVDPLVDIRVGLYFVMIGRLAEDASIAGVRAALEQVPAALAQIHPRPQRYQVNRFVADAGLAAPAFERERLRMTFSLLMALVALLLLLTCANAGNVMLASGTARRAELAARQALGAGRVRIVSGVLVESLLLSAVGGLVAVGLAALVSSLMRGTIVLPYLPELGPIALDRRVFAFALAVSMVSSIGAGLLPAWAATRVDLISTLKGGRSVTGGGLRLRKTLIAAQVAASLVLLIGSFLLSRSIIERRRVDPGFDPSPLLTFSVEPGLHGQGAERREAFYDDLMTQLSATGGVVSAALGWSRPFGLMADDAEFRAVDGVSRDAIVADEYSVGPRYFETMGIGLIEGREFLERDLPADDDAREGAVIVSESVARRLFGAAKAIGRTLEMLYPEGARRVIIGVARDVRLHRAFEPPKDALYSPIGRGSAAATIHIRGARPAAALAPALREAVRQADPSLPLYDFMTVREAMDRQMSEEILVGRLTLAFALMATLLAAVGLYGVLAQSVAERRREVGIRAALGAPPIRLIRLVTGDAIRLTATGAALGVALSLWLSGYIESRLFGVDRLDPPSIAAALIVTLVTALLATAIPASRAARVDPASVLRQ